MFISGFVRVCVCVCVWGFWVHCCMSRAWVFEWGFCEVSRTWVSVGACICAGSVYVFGFYLWAWLQVLRGIFCQWVLAVCLAFTYMWLEISVYP